VLSWNHSGFSLDGSVGLHVWHTAHPAALTTAPVPSRQPEQEIEHSKASSTWARLIAKVYEVDPLLCSRCGAAMKVVAVIMDPVEVEKILSHLIKTGRGAAGARQLPRELTGKPLLFPPRRTEPEGNLRPLCPTSSEKLPKPAPPPAPQ
jgi:hypothetical protein